MHVLIATQRAEAALAETRRQAKGEVVRALGEARATRIRGRAEAETTGRVGLAEAEVVRMRAKALGDARLVAITDVAGRLAGSKQPLVPERLVSGGAEGGGTLPQLLTLLLAEKSGAGMVDDDVDLASMASSIAANAECADDTDAVEEDDAA